MSVVSLMCVITIFSFLQHLCGVVVSPFATLLITHMPFYPGLASTDT